MIKLRKATQIISILFFITLLIVAGLPGEYFVRVVDIYPRMSPLLFVTTWINTFRFPIAFLPAIAVVAMTVVLGRFFCGWVCPLGVTFDATDKLFTRRRKDQSKELLRWKPVKYIVLTTVVVAAYFEANLAGWLDPLSFATKLYALVLLPSFEFVSRLVLLGLSPIPGVGAAADNLYSFFKTTVFASDLTRFHGMLAVFLIYAAAALLAYFNRRFWCRFLCPAGAMFALLSKRTVFRRVVDHTKCIGCGKCERACRMGAIAGHGLEGFSGECVECFTCVSVCPEKAVSFRTKGVCADKRPAGMTRRGFLAGLGGAAVAVPMARLAPGKLPEKAIRPPGVASEDAFMQTCLRCGECMRVCPTNGLQPVWLETGLEGLWTPKLAPRTGNCEFSCRKCGTVCPSNAIAELPVDKKQHTVIGRAVFDHNRCIPWSRGENCGVCEEHCPVASKAIRYREQMYLSDDDEMVKIFMPYTVEAVCIGCGTCECVCPVEGAAGVSVTPVAQHIIDVKNEKKKPASRNIPAAAAAPVAVSPVAPAAPATATIAAAASTTATNTLPVKTVVAPPLPGGRLAIQLDPAFPQNTYGWAQEGKPRTAIATTLYELINGGAEMYLEYGFVKVLRKDYGKGDGFLTIDIYMMKDATGAYGIFTCERAREDAPAGVGGDSALNEYEMKFRQDQYYVKIAGDASREEFIGMAKQISAALGGSTAAPKEASMRAKSAADADARTILLVRGPLALKRYFAFSNDDIFGLKKGGAGLCYNATKYPGVSACVVTPGKGMNGKSAGAVAEKALAAKGFSPEKGSPAGMPKGYAYYRNGGRRIGLLKDASQLHIAIMEGEE